MKIAYLTGEYPRATDTFIQREVAALRDLGIEVETCSIRKTSAEHLVGIEQKEEAVRTFHVLPATASPVVSIKAHLSALRAPARYFRALALAWRTAPKGIRGRLYNLIYFAESVVLADHMARIGVTHLHNHIAKASCTVAMLASEVCGIPYSFTLHGPDIFFAPDHWRLDEKIARARFVACISEFCRAQAMLNSDQTHWPKLKIIHCGIDPARYETVGDRSGTKLLFIGRLAGVKGLPILLNALAEVHKTRPDITLTLVGDGEERLDLQHMAATLNLTDTVDFVGYKSQTEVADLLAISDCLVLPSFAEGVPVVLMEAMAARMPTIATLVGGTAELVTDGATGCLIAPGDGAALCDAILNIMGGSDRIKMGAAGRAEVVENFDIQTEAARLACLFHAGQNLPPEKRPGGCP